MNLICPECKNAVDISDHASLQKDQIIECNICGITLMVTDIDDKEQKVEVEIVDEGK